MNLEIVIFNQLHGLIGKSVCFDALAIFFAKDFIWFLAVLSVLIYFLYRHQRRPSKIFFLGSGTFILSYILLLVTQFIYFRPRPFVSLKFDSLINILPQNPSFPSSHTIFAFVFALVVFFINKKWGILFLVLASLIGFSRILVGAHWPSDVLASILIVILSFYLIKKLLKSMNL